MSKNQIAKITTSSICAIGLGLLLKKIAQHYCTSKIMDDNTPKILELDSEFKSLTERVPKVIELVSKLNEFQDIIDSFMMKCEGKITPGYLYKITNGVNVAYLLGTNHAVNPIIFKPALYNYLKASSVFVTEVAIYNPEYDDLIENNAYNQETDSSFHITLPAWANQLSSYDQDFLIRFFQEQNALYVENRTPAETYNFLRSEIHNILMRNSMDKLLASYFFKNVKGDLKNLENHDDIAKADSLLYNQTTVKQTDSELTNEDLYYINEIDLTIISLCNGSNAPYILQLLRKICGIKSLTHDTITSIHNILKAKLL
jgi:hypothetical protein